MSFALFYLISGIFLIYLGAEGLVRGSSSLAFRLGLTRLVIGLTIVAFGTSMPEMVVSIQTAWARQGDISLGNVIGSNMCNIALILGLSSLVRPLRVNIQVIRLQIPTMIGVSFLIWALLLDRVLTRVEGASIFLGILLYIYGSLYLARKEFAQLNKENESSSLPMSRQPPWQDVLFIIGGLIMLVMGARIFVSGAVSMAKMLHISEAVIGLTVIAVGTSLPELATSVVASFRREGDIAIGNVVGSNIFNILAILGIASLVRPIEMGDINATDIFIMIITAVLLLPLAWSGFIIKRWEGGLLLAVYVGYILHLLW
jgi:cation:H+ antiporter